MNHYASLSLTSRKSSVHLHALYSPRTVLRTFTPRRDQLVICGQYIQSYRMRCYVKQNNFLDVNAELRKTQKPKLLSVKPVSWDLNSVFHKEIHNFTWNWYDRVPLWFIMTYVFLIRQIHATIFWYYYVFLVYHSSYNPRSTFFELL
jgi:hypothetical protein